MWLQLLVFSLIALSTSVLSKRAKILAGDAANVEEFPYMAALIRIDNGNYECAGAIISKKDILTATHCLHEYKKPSEELKFVIGSTNLTSPDTKSLNIERVFLHPLFRKEKDNNDDRIYYYYDIAIAKVKEVIEFNNFISKINLPTAAVETGDFGLISGWGTTSPFDPTSYSKTLNKVWMRVYDRKYCLKQYPLPVQVDQFCGFQKRGVGPCIGDGGSPLVMIDTMIGIASSVVPCGTGFPDIYTNVFHHMKFINSFMSK